MKRVITSLFLILTVSSACNFNRRKNHIYTKKVTDSLYIEKFLDDTGGVYASDISFFYLTDSVDYMKYIGSCDDDDFFYVELINEQLYKIEGTHKKRFYPNRTTDTTLIEVPEKYLK